MMETPVQALKHHYYLIVIHDIMPYRPSVTNCEKKKAYISEHMIAASILPMVNSTSRIERTLLSRTENESVHCSTCL